jgi:hypothetical protein
VYMHNTHTHALLTWMIKLILGLIILTIQKSDLVNMAGVLDALKSGVFAGDNHFKRWQTRAKFWLMSMKVWWVINQSFLSLRSKTVLLS